MLKGGARMDIYALEAFKVIAENRLVDAGRRNGFSVSQRR